MSLKFWAWLEHRAWRVFRRSDNRVYRAVRKAYDRANWRSV